MKISKIALSIVLSSVLFFSCKNADSQANVDDKVEVANEIAVATKPETASIKIEGMTCAIGCAKTIEENLSKVKGVQKAAVDFDAKMATINFDADKISAQDLVKTIENSADGKTYKVAEVKTANNS
jgi:periplasmic mercuric ion binding protein